MKRLLVFLLVTFFSVISVWCVRPPIINSDVVNPVSDSDDGVSYRLMNEIIPARHNVWLTTNIHNGNLTYEGVVQMHFNVMVYVKKCLVNYDPSLTIRQILVKPANDGNALTYNYTLDSETQIMTVNTKENMRPDTTYSLTVWFVGKHSDDTTGFHYATYMNEKGELKYLVSTQFQSIYARKAFPCFDEPRFRTPFTIHITHHNTLHALSNMPISTIVSVNATTTRTTFEETPPMPTYLIAFVVSDFNYTSNSQFLGLNGLLQRIYSRPEDLSKTKFALETSVQILPVQEQYFGQNLKFPKMDHIAIPDFQYGAAESFGLVTYMPRYLLFEEGVSTILDKEYIVSTISHEFAHMFFGNLVIPKWWSYLWITEGFATLYEYITTNKIYPELRISELFVIDVLHKILVPDSKENTRSMTYYIESPNNIEAVSDGIVYSKAASILRMMQYALTEATFQKGVQKYLAKKLNNVSEPDDLFSALQDAADEDSVLSVGEMKVEEVMNSWSLQKGYPVVNVIRDYESGVVKITQEHFLSHSLVNEKDLTWWIPLNFVTANDPNFVKTSPDYWLPQHVTEMVIEKNADKTWISTDWLLFNVQQTGYYRVNYDIENWKMLAHELVTGNLDNIIPINRAQLIDDSMELANAGYIEYDIVLLLLQYLDQETDIIPWLAADRHIDFLARMLIYSQNFTTYQQFIRERVTKIYSETGTLESEDDNPDHARFRSRIVNIACQMELADCLNATKEQLYAEMQSLADDNNIPKIGRSVYFCHGIRSSNDNEVFLYVWDRLQNSMDKIERINLIDSLGCSQNSNFMVDYLLENAIKLDSFGNYSIAERLAMLATVYKNGHISIAIEYILNNQDDFLTTFENYTSFTAFNEMANYIINNDMANQFSQFLEFLDANGIASEELTTAARSTVTQNLKWLQNYEIIIFKWLNEYYYDDTNEVDENGDNGSNIISLSITIIIISVANILF